MFNQNPNVKVIVVQSSYCCSVVSVNTSNTVQPLTFGCSIAHGVARPELPAVAGFDLAPALESCLGPWSGSTVRGGVLEIGVWGSTT